MQSAVCMGGFGSKFGIKCVTYNKVGMSYVVSMKERKNVFSAGNVEFCGKVKCKDM